MKPVWRMAVLAIIAGSLIVWVIGSSSTFQKCICNSEYQQSSQTSKESSSHFAVMVIYKNCLGTFLNENSGSVTALATALIALFTIILALSTIRLWKETKESSVLSRKTLVLTQRPKLRVRNIVVNRSSARPHAPELFWNGELISGQFYVSNIGGMPATITGSGCWVEWMQHRLPMERPYEDKVANNPIAIGTELAAGGSSVAVFQSDRPMGNEGWSISSCSNGWCIYIMGWIEYIDDIGTKRRTAFCRVFEMPQGRFYPVKNEPDYDHEE